MLTHLGAESVRAEMDYLSLTCPDSRFVVCFGGTRSEYAKLQALDGVYIDDPTLRAPAQTTQSYNEILRQVWETWVAPDPSIECVYVFEYDHFILRGDFELPLLALMETTRADFAGKNCADRTSTNWKHYTHYRRDEQLLAYLRSVSVRNDKSRLFGCLGDGFVVRRSVLEALAALRDPPACYGELFLPTVVHHLGFQVADIDAHSDLYRHVRYEPGWRFAEVASLKARGAYFAHPVKQVERILELADTALPTLG